MKPAMEYLAQRYPDLQLSVRHDDDLQPSLEALRRGTADILIQPSTILDERYVEHHHWCDDYRLIVPSASQAGRTLIEIAQTVPYVAWRHAGIDRLHSQLFTDQLRLRHRGELSCLETLLELVIDGHYLSVLPSALLPDLDPRVQYLPLPAPVARRISVIARPISLLSNAAIAVLEALKLA